MKIKIHLKIFIFIAVFILTRQIELYGVLMLFAFIHELGHILSGIILGFKLDTLNIMPFGLSIQFKVSNKEYNQKVRMGNKLAIKKLFIALSGPLTNLIFILIFFFFNISFFGIDRELVIYSNLLIGLFNLLPIYPLDGGRILKNILHIAYGLEYSYKYTNEIAKIIVALLTAVGSIAILYFKNIAIILILGYLWYLVFVENKRYKNKAKIYESIKEANNLE